MELDSVHCQSCNKVIGYYRKHNDQTWLWVWPLLLESAHGICVVCGAEWHWEASSQTLEKLVERHQAREPISVLLPDEDYEEEDTLNDLD